MPQRWRTSARRGFAAVVAVVAVSLVVGLLIDQVSWSRSDGRVRSFDATVQVRPDGSMRVRETVRLRFDAPERAPSEQRRLRTYEKGRQLTVGDVRLRDGDGRPLRPDVTGLLGERRLRFDLPGDPNEAVRTYVLSYTVDGSATPLENQTLLEHDLLSSGLGRDVDSVRVTIRGGSPNVAGCLTGPPDQRRFCAMTELSAGRVLVGENELGPSEGLAFSVRFEPALADVEQVHPADPPVAPGSVVVLRVSLVLAVLLAIGTFAMLRQRSRPRAWWRQWRGNPTPPVDVRPGQAGVLLTGTAGPEHLTAMLLDLVRRGHLEMTGSGETAVLRQPAMSSSRDELALSEWSLLLKIFATDEEVRLADVRADAGNWSYELLDELEREVTEESGWRRSERTTRIQRMGWLVAMGLVTLGYLSLAVLAVTAWPEVPVRDLGLGAVVTVLWAAGCAELASRIAPGALTLRGRLVFAEVDAWARYVDRRGVDEGDPTMKLWAVAFGVRPDPVRLPVVPPSERSERRDDDREVSGVGYLDDHHPAAERDRGEDADADSGAGPAARDVEIGDESGTSRRERSDTAAVPTRIFDDEDDDLGLP